MYTDRPPIDQALREEFFRSDRLDALSVPADDRLTAAARSIEAAMQPCEAAAVRKACGKFVVAASDFHGLRRPEVRVLAARPLRVREGGWASELFGDYDPRTGVIRAWMRTAVPPIYPFAIYRFTH